MAKQLVSERNDVTVVDQQPLPLRNLQDRLDLRTLRGNGVHPSVLRDAGAEDADMLIAATQHDASSVAVQREELASAYHLGPAPDKRPP